MAKGKSNDEGARRVATRPVEPDDEAFLYEVYASTRQYEVGFLPWDDAQKETFLKQQFRAQRDYYRQQYPDALYQVILLGDRAVGRLYVHGREKEIRVLDITLLPQYRGLGLGTPLIREVMSEGERSNRAVSIYVDNYSPAQRLFERLGFSRIEDNGVSVLFKWEPSEANQTG